VATPKMHNKDTKNNCTKKVELYFKSIKNARESRFKSFTLVGQNIITTFFTKGTLKIEILELHIVMPE
jgi:hypothetical protein